MFNTSSSNAIVRYLNKANMIQAYKRITEENGPSSQLMAFINYDQTLNQELGLESFDNLSLEMQHALLLANFNESLELAKATESLGDMISKWLGKQEKVSEEREDIFEGVRNRNHPSMLGHLSIEEIIKHGVVENKDVELKDVENYYYFNLYVSSLHYNYKFTEQELTHIPSDFTEASWKKYEEENEHHSDDLINRYDDISIELANKHFHKGNDDEWNALRFQEGVKSYISVINNQEKLLTQAKDKLERIEQWFKAEGSKPENKYVLGKAGDLIKTIAHLYTDENNVEKEVRTTLIDVSKKFEIKK